MNKKKGAREIKIKPIKKKDFLKKLNSFKKEFIKNFNKLMKKINYEKNKKIIIITSLILLGVVTALVCFFAVSNGGSKVNDSDKEVIGYKDDGSLALEINFKNNKMQDFALELTKQDKLVLEKEVKRENNEIKKTIDLRKVLYENGFGFYDVKLKFKRGLFGKKYKKHIAFTKIEEVKNAYVDANYYTGRYILNIENLPDIKKYEVRVEKNSKIKEYNYDVKKEDENSKNIVIDITEAIQEFGTGTYTIQIDNIVNKNVRGLPKVIQFTAKKIVEKPNAKITQTSIGRKILEIEEKENVNEYEITLNKGDAIINTVKVKSKLDITDYLYKNNRDEGIYTIDIKPIVNEDNVIVSENIQNSSIKTITNVNIKYPLPEIKEIRLGNTIFNNKPEIIIEDTNEDIKYIIEVNSKNIKKVIDYKVLEKDKAFLSKDEIDSLEEGEEVTVTVTKEIISTKDKSYPFTKTFIKKINKDLIPFGYLVEE